MYSLQKRWPHCGLLLAQSKLITVWKRVGKKNTNRQYESAQLMIVDRKESQHYLYMTHTTNSYDSRAWILDSGASKHFCGSKDYFVNLKPIEEMSIRLGNNSVVFAKWMGDVVVKFKNNVEGHTLKLKDVLFIPEIAANLFSVSELDIASYSVIFKESKAVIITKSGQICASGKIQNGLYYFDGESSKNFILVTQHEFIRKSNYCLWHSRFGHFHSQSHDRH